MHPALKLILTKGVGVSLQALMAAQSDGLWYDFSKTDRLFQESFGPTPANDPNEVIGLALSQRLWGGRTFADYLASQPQLATVTTQAAVAAGGPAFTNYTVGPALVIGRCYEIKFDVAGYSGTGAVGMTDPAGRFEPDVGGGISGNGSVTVYGTAATAVAVELYSQTSNTCTFTNISIKEVSRRGAAQSTAGFKPKYQTAGATFDANDDSLLTGYLAQNGANFIVAYVDVPASIPATQVVAGASGAAANRCFLAFNTSGQLCGGVGSNSTSTILGTTDWRGQTVVIGLSFDGSTVKLFAGTAEEYSGAQASTPTTSIPFRVGALNNNGTAGSFSGAALKDLLVGRQALTLAQFNSIRTQLLAGA